jgi:hypothetical protein
MWAGGSASSTTHPTLSRQQLPDHCSTRHLFVVVSWFAFYFTQRCIAESFPSRDCSPCSIPPQSRMEYSVVALGVLRLGKCTFPKRRYLTVHTRSRMCSVRLEAPAVTNTQAPATTSCTQDSAAIQLQLVESSQHSRRAVKWRQCCPFASRWLPRERYRLTLTTQLPSLRLLLMLRK